MAEPVVGLTVVRNQPEAEIVCGMLKANGIACTYRQTSFGAGTMDGMPGGPQEILVSESDLERARYVLDDQAD